MCFFPHLEHSNADPGSWQPPGGPHFQYFWYQISKCFREGVQLILKLTNIHIDIDIDISIKFPDNNFLTRAQWSESLVFLKDRNCLSSAEGWRGWLGPENIPFCFVCSLSSFLVYLNASSYLSQQFHHCPFVICMSDTSASVHCPSVQMPSSCVPPATLRRFISLNWNSTVPRKRHHSWPI